MEGTTGFIFIFVIYGVFHKYMGNGFKFLFDIRRRSAGSYAVIGQYYINFTIAIHS